MAVISAVERGRNLVITVGDESDGVEFIVKPLSAKIGSSLFALWAGVRFGVSENPERDAEAFSRLALGEEHWELVEELRSEETNNVINAAFFWNVMGGGIDLVNTLLRDGYPKAMDALLETNGLSTTSELLQTLQSSASASPTRSQGDTPATNTRNGSGTSFSRQGSPKPQPPKPRP